jgi:Protein of unknown function (DUF2612)
MPIDPYHIDFVEQGLGEITNKHWTQPNYRAFLAAILKQFQPLMDACEQMMLWRDIDEAEGDALLKIAEIVGAPNVIDDPLLAGADDPYQSQRIVIRAKILKNQSHGYTPEIQRSLAILFGADLAFVQNNFDMSFDVNIGSVLSDIEIKLVEDYDILPRPAGVQIKNFVYWDSTLHTFGFDHQPGTYGFDDGYLALTVVVS